MNNNLPLRALQIFETCARLESFSHAASELCITQSAVSQQIKSLEDYFLEKLFIRKCGRLHLTEAGVELKRRLSPVFYDLNSVCSSLIPNMENEVRVHTYNSLAARWLVPHMAKFQQENPGFNINVGMYQDDIDMSDTVADIFITTRQKQEDYIITPLTKERLSAYCSPKYLAQHSEITLDNIHQHTLLISKHKDYGIDWEDWFKFNQLTPNSEQLKLFFNHNMLAVQAALYGHGIVLGMEQTLQIEVDNGNLVKLDLPTCMSGLTYSIAYKRSHQRDRRVLSIVNWIINEVSSDPHAEPIVAH
ncbi:LysR family transcriptional regulator [Shewanella sp. WXL01]|uniref:LysR substrate-binding domain-containing protein n=1 Tax=Shewanella sp. WXL01 TaxID=2709721 RepID=UPI0014383B5F|nr:LysR substrate-binding domain-containing protein [Shewanella sp. WXL01]NKF49103.1 LysR family transcriptional regulator [Shewanella sp. WXL01]